MQGIRKVRTGLETVQKAAVPLPKSEEINMKERIPLSLTVLKKFRLIYGAVRQHFREIEQTCGVSGSQLWVLQEIANWPGIGVSEVAQLLSIHQSTCSQLVEKLVGLGLVVKARSLEDQRRVGLSLSEKAGEILPRAPSPAEGVLPKALMSVPDETLRALDAALAEVIRQLRLRDEAFAGKPLADL